MTAINIKIKLKTKFLSDYRDLEAKKCDFWSTQVMYFSDFVKITKRRRL